MPNTGVDYLHVVAAVIRGIDGRILLARRPLQKSQGGKWEFPGGKVESGETARQALSRELQEEIGITPLQATPLIQVHHVYVERAVFLDVWEVTQFAGEPYGREGQPLAWFSADELPTLDFPAANYAIVTAVRLPDEYLITPEPVEEVSFLQQLEAALQTGVRLVQFRAKTLDAAAYLRLAAKVIDVVHAVGGKVLLNTPPQMLAAADGLHLTSRQLRACQQRQALALREGQWLAAACHNLEELQQAAALGVDFALLSPVLPTVSHPDAATLGWEAFATAVAQVNFPVYALGGLAREHTTMARAHGGQGIAAIRGLWGGAV